MDKHKRIHRDIKNPQRRTIRNTLTMSFTIISVVSMIILGFSLYLRFATSTEEMVAENNLQLLEEVNLNLDSYLRNMMRISDVMYYSVIKKVDLAEESLDDEMNLLYQEHQDSLISIAVMREDGELVASIPVNTIKKNLDVSQEDWFINANEKIENQHFSSPHVQNLFEYANDSYHWVVSLSRMVELTNNGRSERGVLLVDMNYNGIEQLFKKINVGQTGYVYLVDKYGEIIYHPKQQLIYSNLMEENNLEEYIYEDGTHKEKYQGRERLVTVKTVGYTGWKIICVAEQSDFSINLKNMRVFVFLIMFFSIAFMIFANYIISEIIANPIRKLEKSVKGLEDGNLNVDIYIGGSEEIRHLGVTLTAIVERMRQLMSEILNEQEIKRKREFEALQSQINPHFLYNTLDSIVWMIECGRHEEAITMVTSLASLFRISLSKGKNIIMVKDELDHIKYYMTIQEKRYKNRFVFHTVVEEDTLTLATIKLIVQPLLENAIYYGVEHLIDEGIITVMVYRKESMLCIDVIDNGAGIPESQIPLLLTGAKGAIKKGSGIGLRNVHERIQLFFGERYGLQIESELDVGTTIHICLPILPYDEVTEEGKNEKI
ncbi:sensor histidine kinase [Anaerosporobacter sp.]|uniref:sensor histidine kinase n=1 Tax=Anaerosporobacter sp. TaxID=1872529 RepID=UPI00289857B5|nr:sensor histidine kinase [Anaerosporobacter sp.]